MDALQAPQMETGSLFPGALPVTYLSLLSCSLSPVFDDGGGLWLPSPVLLRFLLLEGRRSEGILGAALV